MASFSTPEVLAFLNATDATADELRDRERRREVGRLLREELRRIGERVDMFICECSGNAARVRGWRKSKHNVSHAMAVMDVLTDDPDDTEENRQAIRDSRRSTRR